MERLCSQWGVAIMINRRRLQFFKRLGVNCLTCKGWRR